MTPPFLQRCRPSLKRPPPPKLPPPPSVSGTHLPRVGDLFSELEPLLLHVLRVSGQHERGLTALGHQTAGSQEVARRPLLHGHVLGGDGVALRVLYADKLGLHKVRDGGADQLHHLRARGERGGGSAPEGELTGTRRTQYSSFTADYFDDENRSEKAGDGEKNVEISWWKIVGCTLGDRFFGMSFTNMENLEVK